MTWIETTDFENEKQQDVYDSSLVGWEVLRAICHRYEAYSVIHEFKRPRGPKKGEVPKNTELRDAIIEAIKIRASRGEKVVLAHIAKELGISAPRLSKLVKELNLTKFSS